MATKTGDTLAPRALGEAPDINLWHLRLEITPTFNQVDFTVLWHLLPWATC